MSCSETGEIDLELAKAALGETDHARAEADHHPADLRAVDQVLQRAAERSAEQEAPQEHRLPAAGLHVPGATSTRTTIWGGVAAGPLSEVADGTTIMHAVGEVESGCKAHSEISRQIQELEDQLHRP